MNLRTRKNLYRVFAAFFFLVLLAPNVGLFREKRNAEVIPELENRFINPKPVARLFSNKYFSQFEAWYNDRLLGRKELIRGWASLNYRLFGVFISKEVVKGKDGFMFSNFNMSREMIDQDKKLANYVKMKELCEQHNAKFLFFVAPNSEFVLGELFPEKCKPVNVQKLEQETSALFKARNIDYCFVASKFNKLPLEERKGMYYTADYHWNSAGAFFATKELLHYLGWNKVIDSPIYTTDVTSLADIYTKKTGLSPVKSTYKQPWSKDFVTEFTACTSADMSKEINLHYSNFGENYGHKGEQIYYNKKLHNGRKVLILGDSFFGAMAKYLLQDIDVIVYSHNSDIRSPKKSIDIKYLLETYKPDLVIYEKMGAFFYSNNYNATFDHVKL